MIDFNIYRSIVHRVLGVQYNTIRYSTVEYREANGVIIAGGCLRFGHPMILAPPYCVLLYTTVVSRCVLYCTVLYCTVLYSTAPVSSINSLHQLFPLQFAVCL